MARSNNPNRYRDVRKLADIALVKGECLWQHPKHGTCVNLTHKFNTFRRLMEHIDRDTKYASVSATVIKATEEGELHTIRFYINELDIDAGIVTEYDESELPPAETPSSEAKEDDPWANLRDLDEDIV